MEKQIEEMVCNACITKPTCTDMEKAKCMRRNFAICVIKQGYRKASDVAREIFVEIEELLNEQTEIACETRDKHRETFEPNLSFLAMLDGRIYSLRVVEEHIAEHKKKYESEGGE